MESKRDTNNLVQIFIVITIFRTSKNMISYIQFNLFFSLQPSWHFNSTWNLDQLLFTYKITETSVIWLDSTFKATNGNPTRYIHLHYYRTDIINLQNAEQKTNFSRPKLQISPAMSFILVRLVFSTTTRSSLRLY